MKMNLAVLAGILVGSASLANATTAYDWQFWNTAAGVCSVVGVAGGGNCTATQTAGNSFQFTSNGVTATVSAYSSALTVNVNSTFSASAVEQYGSYGLGVCSTGDVCNTSPDHMVDDIGARDYLVITFSKGVSPLSALLVQPGGGNDMDLQFWASTSFISTSLAGVNVQSTLAGTGGINYDPFSGTCTGSPCNTASTNADTGVVDSLTAAGNGIRTLIIAAGPGIGGSADATNDAFKVNSLQAAPEPATFVMIGSGLLGAAFLRRRKNAKANE